jgi:uncharacterized repeat protein (TIGR01451 family)
MKRFGALLIVSSMLVAQLPSPAAFAASDDDYDDAIEFLKDEGIAEGYLDGSFGENKTINRAEFTKIIVLATMDDDDMRGSPELDEGCFYDVHSEWFAMYVCTAKDHGMVQGYQDGMFHPERAVTFAEAASVIVRAYDGNVSGNGPWYMPYIDTLDDWNAVPPTVRGVHEPITRGEMAYIIWKIEEGSDDEDDEDEDEDDEDEDIEVSINAPVSEVTTGSTITFTITIENESNDDISVDVEATLDDGLNAISASDDGDVSGDEAEWDDIDIDEDDDVTLTLTAIVDANADVGDELTVEVNVEGEEDDIEIRVKQLAAQPNPQPNPQPAPQPNPASPVGDPVLFWNAVALQANADDHSGTYGNPQMMGPCASSYALAAVHAAVYEAVNSIDKTHQPFIALIPVQQNEKASYDAAVASAAYKTLMAMHSNQKVAFDASFNSHMSRIPEGAEKTAGVRIGEAAAQQILNSRLNDGSAKNDPHTASNLPGRHRKDPVNPEQPFMGAYCGEIKPFAIAASWQFRASPPPALTSKEYADAFNEVKQYGGDGVTTPTIRTKEQTEIGIFWAYDGVKHMGTPPRLYNQIARQIAIEKKNTIAQNARLFALINIVQADGGIAAWESKYHYDVWRPIVGIREADAGTGPTGLGDNNPLTTGDVYWTPLGAPMSNRTASNFTPPFPAYPSGHATFGAAAFRTIALFYGTDNIPFTFTSDELNGVTTDNKGVVRPLAPRNFRTMTEAIRENAQSRVYLGVHWQFDQQAGMKMGEDIAEYTFRNALKPVK